MYTKNFFPVYKGEVAINDGVRGCTTKAKTIIAREDNGNTRIIKTGLWCGKTAIKEWKDIEKGKVVFWMRFGAFQRWDNPTHGRGVMRYHPDTLQRLHGLTEVFTNKFNGHPGKTTTRYSWGKFMHQEFWYRLPRGRRRRAYSFHHNDKKVVFKHPDGAVLGEVSCPGGFRIFQGSAEFKIGNVCFSLSSRNDYWDWGHDADQPGVFNFSKDGSCEFVFYDRRGRVRHRGKYENRQRSGEWVLNGRAVYFVRGVTMSKKLWDTPPEKLDLKKVLRVKNAQMRAALLSRVGAERLAKKLKSKIIHKTKNGMKLMEFPIKVDDGNGNTKSHMRILMVTCPSTKNKYYLNVPDFVWDDGRRTRLDTCEAARQWTFGVDNPRERIKFAVET